MEFHTYSEQSPIGLDINTIYTSYFSSPQVRRIYKGKRKNERDMLISIALSTPKKMDICSYPYLFPTKEILFQYKGDLAELYLDKMKDMENEEYLLEVRKIEEEYRKNYKREVLDRLNVEQVFNDLHGKILLCYETPDAFCHRHEVEKWLKSFGIQARELGKEDSVELLGKEVEQSSLKRRTTASSTASGDGNHSKVQDAGNDTSTDMSQMSLF